MRHRNRSGATRHALFAAALVGLLSIVPSSASALPLAVAGGSHTCAVTATGGVKCWGNNSSGQLGDGTTISRSAPADVTGLTSGVVAVAAGEAHTCALTNTGAVKCWGENSSGQLGDGSTQNRLVPVDVAGLTAGVAAIATGGWHSCAITAGGATRCWGANGDGQLGDGTTVPRSLPTMVYGLTSGIARVTAGARHTCALTTSGGVQCWGNNDYGQVGNGVDPWWDWWSGSVNRSTLPAHVVGLASGIATISAGTNHTCAVTTTGAAKCWGDDSGGQLGIDQTSWVLVYCDYYYGYCYYNQQYAPLSSSPVDVIGLGSGVGDLAAGGSHTCAVMSDGTVKCWGANRGWQLGDATNFDRLAPVDAVVVTAPVVAVTAGGLHTCATSTAGRMLCWGTNESGQLGAGALKRLVPGPVAGLGSGAASISANEGHSCSITSSGGLQCWGRNGDGQLGDGTRNTRTTPVGVVGTAAGVAQVATGGAHTCAVTTAGGVRCWGANPYGQLGDETLDTRLTPVDVPSLIAGVAQVTAGATHTCALTTNGAVKCWGNNSSGQLGQDYNGWWNPSPLDVVGLQSGVVRIAAGANHTCALTETGGVKCWGQNDRGQLGDGTGLERDSPVDVTGLTGGVVALAAGGAHTCALLSNGSVKCWGANADGQLGDGTTQDRLAPVDVSGLASGVTAIAAGGEQQYPWRGVSCAVVNGGVKCWGSNAFGQVGAGTDVSPQLVPTAVSGLTSGGTSLAAGSFHACAVVDAGVQCWGAAWLLGDGSYVDGSSPVIVTGVRSPIRITSAASATFPVLSAITFTVTAVGEPVLTLAVTGTLPGGVTFAADTGVLSGTPTQPGVFPLTFTASNGVDPAATQAFTLTVTKAIATLTLGQLSSTYDGTPKPVTVTTTPPGLTDVTVTYDGSPTAPSDAGSYAVVAALNNPFYDAANATGTLVITPHAATLTLGGLAFTYDGTPKPVTVTTSPPGLSGVTVTYDGSSTPPTNAGTYAVVASLADSNYQAVGATGALVIGKAAAMMAFDSLAFTYDGTPKPATVTTTPPGLSAVTVSYNGSPTPPSGVGSYAVVASLANVNYQAPDVTGTLLIASAAAPVISSVAPARVAPGRGPLTFTLTGAGFVDVATVLWNGSPRTTTVVSAGEVQADISMADLAAPGRVVVTLQNGSPASSATAIVVVGDLGPDFNGDGKPDIVWRNRVTGEIVIRLMNGTAVTSEVHLAGPSDVKWNLVAIADFDRDGKADLLWRHPETGDNQIWYMDGATFASSAPVPKVGDREWRIVAAADFNDDGKPDIVWRNAATGDNIVWFMNGAEFVSYARLPSVPDQTWQIAGAGDFSADGRAELLWRNWVSGENVVWSLAGGAFADYARLASVDVPWRIVGIADFNGDGNADILWRDPVTGDAHVSYYDARAVVRSEAMPVMADREWDVQPADGARRSPGDFDADGRADILWRDVTSGGNRIWYMNGATRVSDVAIDPEADPNWRSVAVADFDGDGLPDIAWRNQATGDNRIWLMRGKAHIGDAAPPPVADINWRIVAAADFNADGKADLVWRNAVTGQNVVWFMNRGERTDYASIPHVPDPNWQIAGAGDFNGDGKPDLVWRNAATGENIIWFMDGVNYASYTRFRDVPDTTWKIAAVADYDGDGEAELLWRNGADGGNIIWHLRNAAFVSYEWLPPLLPPWATGPGQ